MTVLMILWIVVAAAAYREILADLLHQWQTNPSYSHGWLVVPIAGWLLWHRRNRRPPLTRPWLPASALLVAAHLLLVVGDLFFLPGVQRWTLPLWISGFVGIAFGRAMLRWSLPAILFTCFMIPLPFQPEQLASQSMQFASAWLSCALLGAVGIFAVTDGHWLVLDLNRIEITEACSGLRITTSLIALGLVLAILSRGTWRTRAAFLLLGPPTALAANTIRICAFAWAVHHCRVSDISAGVHDAGDWLMIPLAAGLMLAGIGYGRLCWRCGRELLCSFRRARAARCPAAITGAVRRSAICLSPFALGLLGFACVQHYIGLQAEHRAHLLHRASTAEARENWAAAIAAYEQYLRFAPNHFPTRRGRAIALEQLAVSDDARRVALRRYAALLRESPYDARLLQRHLRLALSLDAAEPALISAQRLAGLGLEQPAVRHALFEARLRFAPAIHGGPPVRGEALSNLLTELSAGASNEHDTLLIATAAYLCRYPQCTSAAARGVLETHLPDAVNRVDLATGYLARWRYGRCFDVPWADENDLQLALQRCAGRSTEVLLVAAQEALGRHQLDAAIDMLQQAQRLGPANADVLSALGDAHRQNDQPARAVQAYAEGVRASRGGNLLLQFKLAETLDVLGQSQPTLRLLDQLDAHLSRLTPATTAARRLHDDVLLLKSRIALHQGDYQGALAAVHRVETSFSAGDDPDAASSAHAAARSLRVRCLVAMQRYSEAARLFERTAREQAAPQQPLSAAARAWRAAGDVARALACYRRAVNADSAPSDLWLEYLNFLVSEGRLAEASSEVAWRERQLERLDAAMHLRIAQGWELVGRLERAEPHYKAAVELDSQHVAALSIHLARQGKIDEAVRWMSGKATLSPAARVHTLATIGLVAAKTSPDEEEAIGVAIEAGLEDAGDDPQTLLAVASWYTSRGATGRAARLFDRVLELDPENAVALNNRAMQLAEDPQGCAQALAMIDQVLEQAGPAGEFLDTRGWILLRMNRSEEAAEQFKEAIDRRMTADPLPHFHLAAACLEIGDDFEARTQWQRAQQLHLDPATLCASERRALDLLRRRLSQIGSEEHP